MALPQEATDAHTGDTPKRVASDARTPAEHHDAIWDEFASLFDEFASAAAQATDLAALYQKLIEETADALAATGAIAWEQTDLGYRAVATHGELSRPTDAHQTACEALLSRVSESEQSERLIGPDSCLIAAPVRVLEETSATLVAAIALLVPSDRSGAFYDACERLLSGVADFAAAAHRRLSHRSTREELAWTRRLIDYTRRLAGNHDLTAVGHGIANSSRELLLSDRVSLLRVQRGHAELLAVSGAERFERRSGAVRGLEAIARLAARSDDCIAWPTANHDDEPVAEALDAYCDTSHATQLVIAPITLPDLGEDSPRREPIGVLVAESFSGREDLHRGRVTEVACASAAALDQAILWRDTPLATRLDHLARLPRWDTAARSVIALAMFAALLATLLFVRVEHRVTLRGVLLPAEQRSIFAPSDAIVESVLVEDGQRVAEGELLLSLTSPSLRLDINRVEGELNGVETQLRSITAARSSGAVGAAQSLESLDLAAEQRRLQLRLDALAAEGALLREQASQLAVVSPIDGVVVTWRPDELLASRPVSRGQRLLLLSDAESPWRLELDAPDDRVGLILDAGAARQNALPVVYERLSTPGVERHAFLSRIAAQANPPAEESMSASPIVRIEAMPSEPLPPIGNPDAPLPGESVRARVQCGERPLGYVLLHDAWELVTRWWRL